MGRILIGNIKGPQGPRGIQGVQGPIGPIGPVGPLPPLINNALATQAGVAALDAVMGKTLGDKFDKLNSDLGNLQSITGSVLDFATRQTAKYVVASTQNNTDIPVDCHYCPTEIFSSRFVRIQGQSGKIYCNYKSTTTNAWMGWTISVNNSDFQTFFVSESSLFLRNQKNNEMQRVLFANASTSIDSGTNVRHTSADDGTITELSIVNGKLILIKILPNGTRTSKEVAVL